MEINPEYSLEGLMLKLKLQYFGHLMQRAASLEKKFNDLVELPKFRKLEARYSLSTKNKRKNV